jgi:hypothetical protein
MLKVLSEHRGSLAVFGQAIVHDLAARSLLSFASKTAERGVLPFSLVAYKDQGLLLPPVVTVAITVTAIVQ